MTFEDGPLTRSCEVVIVGAGIVGLYTALLLKKQGINVQIYERQSVMYNMPKAMSLSDEMVRSFHLNGFSDLVNDHIVKAGAQSNNPYFLWTDADQSEFIQPVLDTYILTVFQTQTFCPNSVTKLLDQVAIAL